MDNKRSSYTRPWFWLMIILIFSVFFKFAPKDESVPAAALPGSVPPAEKIADTADDTAVTERSADDTAVTERSADDTAVTERSADDTSDTEASAVGTSVEVEKFHFIINKTTKKYHITECSGAKKLAETKREDTEIEAGSLEAAKEIIEKEGYELCGICAKQVKE